MCRDRPRCLCLLARALAASNPEFPLLSFPQRLRGGSGSDVEDDGAGGEGGGEDGEDVGEDGGEGGEVRVRTGGVVCACAGGGGARARVRVGRLPSK